MVTKENLAQWWEGPKEDLAQRIHRYVEFLDHESVNRMELYERNHKLYDLRRDYHTGALDDSISASAVVEDNIVKQIIDTFVAMLGKDKPRCSFQTDGGDWSTQRKAKHFERYIDGMFHQHSIYKLYRQILRDCMLFGTGFLRVDHDGEKVIVERVLPECLKVDEQTCRLSPAKQLHCAKFVGRYDAVQEYCDYPGAYEAIMEAPEDQGGIYAGYRENEESEIMIVESWVLPTKKTKGKYVVSLKNCILHEEEYERDKFPFVLFHWNQPTFGFFGGSLVENVAGTQRRIHKLQQWIDKVQERVVVPRVYVQRSDLGMKARLDKTIGQIVPISSQAPIFETPKGVSGEIFQRLDQLRRQPLEQEGTTNLSVQGKLPSGVESAVAMREYHDIQGDRHTDKRIATEEWIREVAEHLIEVTKDLYTKSGKKVNPEVVWRARQAVKKIKWSEVDPKGDLMLIKIEAASIMSRTPAGRQQTVAELTQAGLVTGPEGRRLLDMPDLDQEMTLKNVMLDAAEHDIEQIQEMKEGDPAPIPDELSDVSLFRERMMNAYTRDRISGAPEHVLEGYRSYISILDDMALRAEQEAMNKQMEMMAQQQASQPMVGSPAAGAGVGQGVTYPRGDLAPGLAEGLG